MSVETTTTGDGVYRFSAGGDESPGTRWYRDAGEQDGSLVRVEDCAVADREGRRTLADYGPVLEPGTATLRNKRLR